MMILKIKLSILYTLIIFCQQIRQRINDTNKDVQARIKTERQKLEKKTAAAESAFFESIQTMMDHLEQRFEPVMLKPSPDVEKYSTEPSAQMTLARTIDMTYRLNLGILHYSAAKAKELTNADAWTAAMRKHFSPSQIRVRANIIRQVQFTMFRTTTAGITDS